MAYVLFNDQVIPREIVKIDMEDRGYNFGDGIYEVVPIYNGEIITMNEHLERFEESAQKLEMSLPYNNETFERLLIQLKEKNNIKDGILYFQMTRGVSPRAHLYERNVEGLITGFAREMAFPVEQKRSGIKVFVTEDIRWLRCDIKTINLLGNTMAKRKAADHLCQEAIMHRNGIMTEGSSSNLFIIKNSTLYTHPATNLILNGITRRIVLKLAKENGYDVVEEAFTTEALKEADEAFITSTSQEITPIVQVTGDVEATFVIGPISQLLQKSFDQYVQKARTNN